MQEPLEPHSLISQFKHIAEIGEEEKRTMFQDLHLPEFPKSKLISVMDYQKGPFKVAMLES